MVGELVGEVLRPGVADLSGLSLWRIGRTVVTAAIVVTNLIGACAVVAIAAFVVPIPELDDPTHVRTVNIAAAIAYVVVVVPLAAVAGARGLFRLRVWMVEERPATPAEKRILLRAPLRLFFLQLGFWIGAAAFFGAFNTRYSGELGLQTAITVAITGVTTASCAYLLTERVLRSAAVRALTDGMPEELVVPGVATRSVLAWALGTGLPLVGLMAIGIEQFVDDTPATASELAVAMVVLGAVGLGVGLLAVVLAARATAAPVDAVRTALARVRRGDFSARVPVYDGTQIGLLQDGFNDMADGLAQRERIREAFGTYVDPDVAEQVMLQGVSLDSREVEVTVVFVDVRGFTRDAEQRPARDVVDRLNRLFSAIVPIVHHHGGRVDKFVGDGLMAVFGAPRELDDHADRAVRAALDIEAAVAEGRAGDVEIGIGVSTGPVIAGNIGAPDRLEFSVIGDAVNVASRVEAATRETGDTLLLTAATAEAMTSPIPLVERQGVTLRGKTQPVRLFAPQ